VQEVEIVCARESQKERGIRNKKDEKEGEIED
jgi:hypothetical protein